MSKKNFPEYYLDVKDKSPNPLVTVVTVTYNLIKNDRKEKFIQALESVRNQTYGNIEHIVIDGASDDGTVDLIKEYADKGWIKYFSEPDDGIYFAMNKGIDKANGEYIVFLNSDDFWHDNRGIEESVKKLTENNADFSYANCIYLDKDDNFLGVLSPNIAKFFVRMPFCHQTMLTKKEIMLNLNKFDTQYKSSADYDFVLRLILSGAKGVEIPLNFTSYRWIGFSATQASSIGDVECEAIFNKIYGEKYNLSEQKCSDLWNKFKFSQKFLHQILKDVHADIKQNIVNKSKKWKLKRGKYTILYEKCFRKVNLLFDGNLLANYYSKTSGRTGIFFLVYNILKELAKRPELNIYLYFNYTFADSIQQLLDEKRKDFPNINIFEGDINTMDIFLSPFFKIPTEIKQSGITCYTIIYDLTPILLPDFHSEAKTDSPFMQMINSLDKNDYMFSISEYTKQDFVKHIPYIDGTKITTTLLAAGENFYQDKDKEKNNKLREKYNIPKDKKYIFSLCTLEPRKNLIFAVKNFVKFIKKNNIDDLVFVLGGGHWEMFIEKLNQELNNLENFKYKIIKAGYIEDEDLASLYSHAEFMVYASIYEGFGLPPLEAMKCGCPVISSNTTSLPEVIGNSGIMINPKDDNALIEAYETLYFDKNLRKELSEKGLERAKTFSWTKCANIITNQILNINLNTPIKSCLINGESRIRLFCKLDLIKIVKNIGATRVFLFNIIPLWEIKERNFKIKHYLFSIFPILKIKETGAHKKYYLFDFLPIFTKKIKNRELITNKPLVTVITVIYNIINNNRKESFIRALESVRNQTYKNIEHIIIDGASDDGTLDIIKEYANKGWINYISEPDTGIYDAMNKGAKIAQGKYILFLNSDDYFSDTSGIEKSVELLEKTKADYSYAKARVVDTNGNSIEHRHNHNNFLNIFTEMPFCHQTMLVKTALLKKLGMFDLQYKSAADYAFVMKLIFNKCHSVFIPIDFVTYTTGGYSNEYKELSVSEILQIYFKEYNKIHKISLDECEEIHTTKIIPIILLFKLIKNTDLGFKTNLKLLVKYLKKRIIRISISLKHPSLVIFGVKII